MSPPRCPAIQPRTGLRCALDVGHASPHRPLVEDADELDDPSDEILERQERRDDERRREAH